MTLGQSDCDASTMVVPVHSIGCDARQIEPCAVQKIDPLDIPSHTMRITQKVVVGDGLKVPACWSGVIGLTDNLLE